MLLVYQGHIFHSTSHVPFLFCQLPIPALGPTQILLFSVWILEARFLALSVLGVNFTACVYLMIAATPPLPLRFYVVYKKKLYFMNEVSALTAKRENSTTFTTFN
jgi:hypothetical protein